MSRLLMAHFSSLIEVGLFSVTVSKHLILIINTWLDKLRDLEMYCEPKQESLLVPWIASSFWQHHFSIFIISCHLRCLNVIFSLLQWKKNHFSGTAGSWSSGWPCLGATLFKEFQLRNLLLQDLVELLCLPNVSTWWFWSFDLICFCFGQSILLRKMYDMLQRDSVDCN